MPDTAIAVQQAISPMEIIQQALSSGASPEVVRELVSLQQSMERFSWEREERQAKIDFDDSLSRCQSKVALLKPNQGRKSNKNQPHDNIFWLDYIGLDAAVRPIYIEEGFSISFSEDRDGKDNYVGMTATLSRGGISREYFKRLTLAPSFDGMPKADAEASAASRVKRYLILQIFNVAIGIDKDEKKPFGAQGTLVEHEVVRALDAIKEARDMRELNSFYLTACDKANEVKDATALLEFSTARDKRRKELQSA